MIPKLLDDSTLDIVWNGYEEAVRKGRIKLAPEPAAPDDPYPGRFLNPHKKVARVLPDPEACRTCSMDSAADGHEPKLLQTIASHKGSQQGVHSDSIHMTTYPLGYLTAAWIAFEDIHPDSGPLVYYPGSHKLPYLFSKDVNITEADFKREGYAPYHARYEPRIQELIATHQIEPHYFHARKGDVLIWHANLLHGGSVAEAICSYRGKRWSATSS